METNNKRFHCKDLGRLAWNKAFPASLSPHFFIVVADTGLIKTMTDNCSRRMLTGCPLHSAPIHLMDMNYVTKDHRQLNFKLKSTFKHLQVEMFSFHSLYYSSVHHFLSLVIRSDCGILLFNRGVSFNRLDHTR